jgi:hypothetical protein
VRPVKSYSAMSPAERMAHTVFSHGTEIPVDWSPEEHATDHDEWIGNHHTHEADEPPTCKGSVGPEVVQQQ